MLKFSNIYLIQSKLSDNNFQHIFNNIQIIYFSLQNLYITDAKALFLIASGYQDLSSWIWTNVSDGLRL